MNKPNPDMMEHLLGLKRQLEAAQHGGNAALVAAFAERHGRSKQTIWRWLVAFAGYTTERKRRSDAGTTKLEDHVVNFIAASKNLSVRANGKATKPTAVAMNIADANGMEINASISTVNRVLRQRKLDTTSQANSRNHIRMRSEGPNHVHQIDPSLCLVYWLGKRQIMMTDAEFNKNKPAAMNKIALKVWRYVRYDHASRYIDVKYYQAAGENQYSLFDFLLHTWGEQPHRVAFGVPKKLLWDKGSERTSPAVCNFLDALGVDHEPHATHHAWVKGGVENANRIVEMQFESRLRDQPVSCVEELNESAYLWVRDYNANAIKFVDSRISLPTGEKMSRDALWQLILQTPEALKTLPAEKVCRWFLTGKTVTRKIRDNQISYVHPETGVSRKYDLGQWAEYYSQKDKVTVQPILLAEGAIRVSIPQLGKDPLVVQVDPVTDFDQFGRAMANPMIGEEYHSAKHTLAEQSAKTIAKTAYGDVNLEEAEGLLRKNVRPFQHLNDGKGVVAHTHLGKGELPARITPKGQDIDNAAIQAARETEVETVRLSKVAMIRWMHGRLGSDWRAELNTELQKRFPDGATEPELEQVLADLKAGRTAGGKARLQAV